MVRRAIAVSLLKSIFVQFNLLLQTVKKKISLIIAQFKSRSTIVTCGCAGLAVWLEGWPDSHPRRRRVLLYCRSRANYWDCPVRWMPSSFLAALWGIDRGIRERERIRLAHPSPVTGHEAKRWHPRRRRPSNKKKRKDVGLAGQVEDGWRRPYKNIYRKDV